MGLCIKSTPLKTNLPFHVAHTCLNRILSSFNLGSSTHTLTGIEASYLTEAILLSDQ